MTTSTFKRANIQVLSTRTSLYTCPASTTAIVFDGQITNIDSSTKASHFITIEIYNGATYHSVFKELEIPYGLSSPMPKQVLVAGEIIYVTCADGTSNVLEIGTQILERV